MIASSLNPTASPPKNKGDLINYDIKYRMGRDSNVPSILLLVKHVPRSGFRYFADRGMAHKLSQSFSLSGKGI
jgi:hypothetical protein